MRNARRWPGIEISGFACITRKVATQLGGTILHIPKAPTHGIEDARIGWTDDIQNMELYLFEILLYLEFVFFRGNTTHLCMNFWMFRSRENILVTISCSLDFHNKIIVDFLGNTTMVDFHKKILVVFLGNTSMLYFQMKVLTVFPIQLRRTSTRRSLPHFQAIQ